MIDVLFISNDPMLMKKNLEVLRQNGLEALGVSGSQDALLTFYDNRPSIVVVDNGLSDVNCNEACMKVRQLPARIVLLDTIPESKAWGRIKELGIELYLRKPVNPRELAARVKALLRLVASTKVLSAKDAEPVLAQAAASTTPQIVKSAQPEAGVQSPGRVDEESASLPAGLSAKQTNNSIVSNHEGGPSMQPVGSHGHDDESDASLILADPRVVKLVDALVTGKLPDITPVVDFNYKNGFAYPSVSSLIDSSEIDTINILEMLASRGILIKELFDRFYVDPDGLFQLVPTERCPRCDSADIKKGQLVEHFSCGYVGMDRDFKQDSRYVCPKCRKEMRLIGTDYRNVGIHYRCQDCNEVSTAPIIKWRNVKSRKIWNAEELREVDIFSYRFSPDKKGWLEFQMKPKIQIIDYLKSRGYQVNELAQLTGKSGAVHTVDILATRDDILTKIFLGIGILVAATGETEVGLESLFRFDTRAYDIGFNYKVVIAIPKLGLEAVNFAARQMIRAYEARTLAAVANDIIQLGRPQVDMQSSGGEPNAPSGALESGARAAVVKFLASRDYEVYENAMISGKSGIKHTFGIFARKDDRLIVPTIAIGIVGNSDGQAVGLDELSRFDAAAFDSGIRNKVFFGLPHISDQARQFAIQQKIDVFEQQDLAKLS